MEFMLPSKKKIELGRYSYVPISRIDNIGHILMDDAETNSVIQNQIIDFHLYINTH